MEGTIPELEPWLTARRSCINQLKILVEELDKYHKGANIASVMGILTAIGGTLVGLGTLALTPVSGGATLFPTLICMGSGVSGSGAAMVGKVAKNYKTKTKLKEVDEVFEEDAKCTANIQAVIKKVEQVEENIVEFLEQQIKANLKEEVPDDFTDDKQDGVCIGNQEQGVKFNPDIVHTVPNSKNSGQLQTQTKNIGSRLLQGIKMARILNQLNVKRFFSNGKVVAPIAENLPSLGVGAGPTAGNALMQLGKVVRYGGVAISVALLPVEVYHLVKTSLELKRGDGHEVSKAIEDQIIILENEMKNIKEYLYEKAKELNNFVLLMNSILSDGCDEALGSLINQILKRILALKGMLKACDRLDVQTHPPFTDSRNLSKLSAVLVNCDGTNDSVYRRLSMFIWCASILGRNTAIFLQNTALTEDPVLWTLFGVSVNSFNTNSGQGVSILLPTNFPGDIVSQSEYRSNDGEWNGRCMVVNINHQQHDYSLVSLLAPQEKISRDLFLKEMAGFIRKQAHGKIYLAANFRCELQTMTVIVRNKVSQKVPFPLIRGLIPFKDVCGYLLIKPKEIDGPMLLTYKMLAKYSLIKSKDIDIKWYHCRRAQVSTDNYRDQIKPISDLGLTDLWDKKGQEGLEFSIEKEVSERVVNCNQPLDFFISPELEGDIEDCYLDHTLRFLGFLSQSALIFRGTSILDSGTSSLDSGISSLDKGE